MSRLAAVLGTASAVFWIAAALVYPLTVDGWRWTRLLATLGLGVLLLAVAYAGRRRALVPALLFLGIGATLTAALVIADDDTRRIRTYFFVGAYRHSPRWEEYDFQHVGDWSWATFLLAAAIIATLVAGAALVARACRSAKRQR